MSDSKVSSSFYNQLKTNFESFKIYIPEKMRTKNWILFSLLVLSMVVMLWLVSNPTPDFHNIVASTHRTLHKLKVTRSHNDQEGFKELQVDEMYLDYLGFTDNPNLYLTNNPPKINQQQTKKRRRERGSSRRRSRPVIGSAVSWRSFSFAKDLADNVHHYLPDYEVVFFDIGLSTYDNKQLQSTCNETINCEVKRFPFNKFPYHIQNTDIKAYKPLAIQELLNLYGAVFWIDLNEKKEYFITGDIEKVLKQAEKVGITAWTVDEPTSALTHPKTFRFFKARREDYYFHRMVSTDRLLLYNLEQIHSHIMLPWVQCSLMEECIRPPGAQNAVCNKFRKPLYRYSGCHHYDMSALNVILGRRFEYDCQEYSSKLSIFGKIKANSTIVPPTL
ncbi:uncharacterized protein LOC141909056 [Tubulanus polymorphus]|uniref:uncharacterized protein LOC141909056 n=1 Tax=Tubulanus polymorphus TaxID=672921 RepID=UPI003DA2325B